MKINKKLKISSIAIFLFCSGTAHAASQYTMVALGDLSGPNRIAADSINNAGQVVGSAYTNNIPHAFLYDGAMHDLGTLGGQSSFAHGINDDGVIIGDSFTAGDATRRAFKYYGGVMHDIGTLAGGVRSTAWAINSSGVVVGDGNRPGKASVAFFYDGSMHEIPGFGGQVSHASDINDAGVVTGYSSTVGGNLRGFIYDGTLHDIGTLGGGKTYAYSINNAGHVVGNSATGESYPDPHCSAHTGCGMIDVYRAFFYDGTMHDLGALGGDESSASAINESGSIVGVAEDASGVNRAFLYEGSVMLDLTALLLNVPGSGFYLRDATGINDVGQILAKGSDSRYYLLTPSAVPVPAAAWLFGSGLFGLVGARRLKRSKR